MTFRFLSLRLLNLRLFFGNMLFGLLFFLLINLIIRASSKELLIELVLFGVDRSDCGFCLLLSGGSTLIFFFEVMLAHFLDLVARNTLLVELALPQHVVDVIRVTLKVTPN
jgi:hypothetical protein